MQYRKFGDTDLRISELGLGCSRLGGNLQGGSEKDSAATLRQALEQGINFYDTADSYGQGKSERLLGQTFKQKRDQVIFATKAGYTLSSLGGLAASIKPLLKPLVQLLRAKKQSLSQARGSFLRQNFASDYLIQAVEGSLRRLQTDYLDLFQLHSPPTPLLESGEVWQTLDLLKQQGKIRYYGVSCDTVADALLCLRHPGLSSVQVEMNLLEPAAIAQVLPLALQANKAVIARQPFASGRLLKMGAATPASEEVEASTAQKYQAFAQQHSRTLIQTALQFVLQQPGVSVVIAGASNPRHLQENLQALQSPALTAAELTAIAAL
jgi:aryl-alcohol dehydrogenase-like predicted oxidoreductase